MSSKVPVISEFTITLDFFNHRQLHRDLKIASGDAGLVLELWKNEPDGSVRQFSLVLNLEEAEAFQIGLTKAIEHHKDERQR